MNDLNLNKKRVEIFNLNFVYFWYSLCKLLKQVLFTNKRSLFTFPTWIGTISVNVSTQLLRFSHKNLEIKALYIFSKPSSITLKIGNLISTSMIYGPDIVVLSDIVVTPRKNLGIRHNSNRKLVKKILQKWVRLHHNKKADSFYH